MEHNHELGPLRIGVLFALLVLVALRRALGDELVECPEFLLALGGLAPDIYPVDRLLGVALDDLDNVLGGVHVGRARRAVAGEVAQYLLRVLARCGIVSYQVGGKGGLDPLTLAEISHFTTPCEEK